VCGSWCLQTVRSAGTGRCGAGPAVGEDARIPGAQARAGGAQRCAVGARTHSRGVGARCRGTGVYARAVRTLACGVPLVLRGLQKEPAVSGRSLRRWRTAAAAARRPSGRHRHRQAQAAHADSHTTRKEYVFKENIIEHIWPVRSWISHRPCGLFRWIVCWLEHQEDNGFSPPIARYEPFN
jgi:hypothetical protein